MADDILQILYVRRYTDSITNNLFFFFFEAVLKYKPRKFKKTQAIIWNIEPTAFKVH